MAWGFGEAGRHLTHETPMTPARPLDLLQDMIAMIEIELSYAAAEINAADHSEAELARAMEHIASAVTMLRKLASEGNPRAAVICDA